MSANRLSAHWPLPSLVRSLSRAGWGPLASEVPGVRLVLRGLADLLDDRTGRALVTAPQLADVTALSERWTRDCLNRLEDLGIIRWTRGGIKAGRPVPSFIEVSKRALVGLIKTARATIDEIRAARRARTAARLAKVNQGVTIKNNRKQNRRSDHAELSYSLLSPSGDSSVESPRNEDSSPMAFAAQRAAWREMEQARREREATALREKDKARLAQIDHLEATGMSRTQAIITNLLTTYRGIS